MIRVQNITKSFGKVEAVRDVSFTVRAGEVASEFVLAVDNEPVDAGTTGSSAPDGERVESIRDLRGTVTGIEVGADGLQVELTVPSYTLLSVIALTVILAGVISAVVVASVLAT